MTKATAPIRVCIFVEKTDPKAGWGRVYSKLRDGLEGQGFQVSACVTNGPAEPAVTVIPFRGFSFLGIGRLIRSIRILRATFRSVDIVHVFDVMPYGLLATIANIGLKKPILLNVFGTYSLFHPTNSFKNTLIAWVYRRATRVVVCSAFVQRMVEQYGFRIPHPITIPVGVDVAYFDQAKKTTYRRPLAAPYILSVGALKARKGYETSIAAFARLSKQHPDLQYVIIGHQFSDGFLDVLKDVIRVHGVEGRVHFYHRISDEELRAFYAHAELFVLTPVTTAYAIEGFGMVYLEAGAVGVPVVGTVGTGAEAAIKPGVNGFCVENTPEAVADAMETILSKPEIQSAMRAAAPEYVKQYDWPRVVAAYIEVYSGMRYDRV